MPKTWDFLPEFISALTTQLESDDKRWGDTWLQRTREGQEKRIEKRIKFYFKEWRINNVPVPWLKIVGEAMIGWIREQHPELWSK